jgi:hypothetical protein
MVEAPVRAVSSTESNRQQPGTTNKASDQASSPISLCADQHDLNERLKDAECLLFYAAEAGIDIDPNVCDAVLKAKIVTVGNWTEQTGANLLSALTVLAAKLKPVTADSLKECADGPVVRKFIRGYKLMAVWLAFFIIPFSVVTFVTSGVSEALRKDIETANKLAVTLNEEANRKATGKDVTRNLQEFAATIRAIDARAWQLNFFVNNLIKDPLSEYADENRRMKFELPADLTDLAIPKTVESMIGLYQKVRHFAQSIREMVATIYGAMGACILPVLYALLGACAYLLRLLTEQLKLRTFTKSDTHIARFLIAAIAGAVVGMFSNFTITEAASIPPLAIAFLVGYAADVFFSFLEGLLQTFTRRPDAQTPSAAKG